MKENVKKVWTDPVFSKMIATGLTTLVISIAIFFHQEFIYLLMLDIKVWHTLSLVLGLLIPYLIVFVVTFRYNEKTRNLDTQLFERIRKELLTQEALMEPRNNGFSGNPFENTQIHFIAIFLEESQKSDFTFFNPKLEKKKERIVVALKKLKTKLGSYIFGAGNGGWLSIPREWEYDDPERYDKAIKEISDCENALVDSYDDFIKTAKRILKV